MTRLVLAALVLAGCGGDIDQGTSSDAAMQQPDATTANVIALASCPATVAATITDSAVAFVPTDTTVSLDAVVKITTTSEHFVIPNPLKTTDPALMVGYGKTQCFQFKTVGTYHFLCGAHSFPGSITVN
jgi:plastocyanin